MMDDSDLALDMALQRLDESSEIEEDSQTGSVYSGDGVSQLEVYTPSNLSSNPNPGCVARRGSYHNSGSEESTSLSSFCTDGEGPARSAVYYRSNNSRRVMPSSRNRRGGVVSDSETSRPRKLGRYSGASLSMNVRVPEEEFYYRIKERLLAVSKDRDTMTMKARDLARQKGQTYDEIMAAEWHELPETRKYLLIRSSEEGSPEEANGTIEEELIVDDNDERPSSPRLTISPSELTPRTAVSDVEVSGRMGPSSQLEEGMRSLNVRQTMTGMSRSKRSSHRTSSSMLSGTASDSGVGDTWATSEIPTPSANDQRLEDYIRSQSILTNTLPTRERDAHAAAIALMSNSPHPDNLSPHIQVQASRTARQQQHYHHHHHHHHPSSRSGGSTRHTHDQQRVGGAGPHHYSSGDDSSSVFTMTSQSSTSDLFIPRKTHQPSSMYTDSEEPHSFGGNMRYRRTLTTPKRSNPSKQHGQQHPSPLTEQHRPRSTQPPQHPDVMLPAPQQNQLPLSQGGSSGNNGGGGGGSGTATGPVHVIYHLDNIPTPFHAKWTNGVGITLGTFKDQVFARKGEYRFFFESFNPDLDMALLEEFTDDESCLPVIRGKIVGRVERAQ